MINWLLPPLSNQLIFQNGLSPIGPVLKRNGQVRICRAFKQIVNPVLPIDKCPIPNIDTFILKFRGAALFYETGFEQCIFTGFSGRGVTETNDDNFWWRSFSVYFVVFWYCFFPTIILTNYRPSNSRDTKDSRLYQRHTNLRKSYGRA